MYAWLSIQLDMELYTICCFTCRTILSCCWDEAMRHDSELKSFLH